MILRYLLSAVAIGLLAKDAAAADFKTLRNLQAPPPVSVTPMAADASVNPVRLSKVVMQPREGEGWALVYTSNWLLRPDNSPPDSVVPWEDGRTEADTAGFARVFDEELKAAGFKSGGESSLFEEASNTDLQVGVLIDDIKGRFCRDCPNLLQREKFAAVVTMNARWEVYSTLRASVVARILTTAGTTWRKPPEGSAKPVIYDAFRENVRALLASEAFRTAVSQAPGVGAPAPPATTIAYTPSPPARRSIAGAADSVAAIFAGDGFGSGFLISSEGYLLTNQHVVGGARYVKVRWPDKSEAVGEVIRSDRRRDVAIVKVGSGARKGLALSHGAPALGANVYVIGTPLDQRLQGTVTKGIVSGKRELDGLAYIQSDAVTNHGNSGGPLLDENGAVLGIAVQIYEVGGAPTGLNLFIPIDDAVRALALRPVG